MLYANKAYYRQIYRGERIPDGLVERFLALACDDVDALTFCRIRDMGFDELRYFSRTACKEPCACRPKTCTAEGPPRAATELRSSWAIMSARARCRACEGRSASALCPCSCRPGCAIPALKGDGYEVFYEFAAAVPALTVPVLHFRKKGTEAGDSPFTTSLSGFFAGFARKKAGTRADIRRPDARTFQAAPEWARATL